MTIFFDDGGGAHGKYFKNNRSASLFSFGISAPSRRHSHRASVVIAVPISTARQGFLLSLTRQVLPSSPPCAVLPHQATLPEAAAHASLLCSVARPPHDTACSTLPRLSLLTLLRRHSAAAWLTPPAFRHLDARYWPRFCRSYYRHDGHRRPYEY